MYTSFIVNTIKRCYRIYMSDYNIFYTKILISNRNGSILFTKVKLKKY